MGTLGAMAIVGKAKVVLPPPPALFSSQWFVAASVALFSVAQGLPALIVASALVSLIGFIRYSWFFRCMRMSVRVSLCVSPSFYFSLPLSLLPSVCLSALCVRVRACMCACACVRARCFCVLSVSVYEE